MEDSLRAQKHFGISCNECIQIVEKYRSRKYDEDILHILNQIGGVESLAEKLKTDIQNGLVPEDLDIR